MKISEKGLNLIKSFEGCKLTAYKDPYGVLTIGYGHTKGVKSTDKITQTKADEFLKEDVATSEKAVNNLSKWYKFNQNEFDALVSFTFNCGSGNLLKLVKNGKRNKGQIADAILLYNKSGGQVLSGLNKRRKAERQLFCTATTTATVTPTQTPKKKTTEEIAREVIKGLWGNGQERKDRLRASGYNPSTIQKKVNELLKN